MIEFKKMEDKDIYIFNIIGDIDEKGVHDFYELLSKKALEHKKIKVLGIINEMPGFESFKALSETVKMKFKAIKVIDRYAVLSDKHWIETILPIGNFFSPGVTVKHFSMNNKDEAVSWLEEN